MSWDLSLRHEKKMAVTRWADRYTARFDQALTAAWPDLVDRLQEAIAQLSWMDLAVGPGQGFNEGHVKPAVQGWVERHVQPLVAEAVEEFRSRAPWEPGQVQNDAAIQAETGSVLEVLDILKALTVLGGPAIGWGAVTAAIVTTTSWLVFTTTLVNWPLLIGGLVVGGALSLFGVYNLAQLRTQLQERFQKKLLPRIQEAVIGDGVQHGGQHIPSLRAQLIRWVEETAEAARRHLDEKG